MKPYKTIIGILLLSISVLSFPIQSFAKGVSLYLPVNIDPVLEMDVERLAVYADMSNLTRPYSIAAIEAGLSRVSDSHPKLHRRLSRTIALYKKRANITHASAKVFYSSSEDKNITRVNHRGNTLDNSAELSIRGHVYATDWLLFNIGAEISSDAQQATGSLLSMGTHWAQLDIGYKEYWLSPFFGSSQLLSTQAQTLPSISLSNNMPIKLSGVGLNYQLFVAELSNQLTAYNDTFNDDDAPLLASVHLSIQPVPWWSLAATRHFQFGGGEREVSLKTLARAFIDPRGADNDASVDEESGNQIASLSSKLIFDGSVPFTLSLEYAGEDASNHKRYQLGNPAMTTGIFFPSMLSDSLSLAYEYSDWDNAWYVNNVYQKGYSNEDFVLGHWGMQDQFKGRSANPGTGHFISAQWSTPWDHILDVKFRTIDNEGDIYQSGWNMDIDYILPFKDQGSVGVGAFLGEDSFGESFIQLRASAQWR